jgi:hypothetical protein
MQRRSSGTHYCRCVRIVCTITSNKYDAFSRGSVSVRSFRHKCQVEDSAKNTWRDYHLIAIHTLHIRGTYKKKQKIRVMAFDIIFYAVRKAESHKVFMRRTNKRMRSYTVYLAALFLSGLRTRRLRHLRLRPHEGT